MDDVRLSRARALFVDDVATDDPVGADGAANLAADKQVCQKQGCSKRLSSKLIAAIEKKLACVLWAWFTHTHPHTHSRATRIDRSHSSLAVNSHRLFLP